MLSIREMPEKERPQIRMMEKGPQALSHAELIALVLGTDDSMKAAYEIISKLNGQPIRYLRSLSRQELMEVKGVGQMAASRIMAAIELGMRVAGSRANNGRRVANPEGVAELVMPEMSVMEQEEFWVILLDTRNGVKQIERLYKGSLNASTIRVGEVFRAAIKMNAAAVILVHNHPTGDPSPSPEDVAVTRAIVDAGKLLDIEVLDHLIIGANRYVSLKERGLGFA